jgi:thiamine kinase-like enzyme
VRVFTAQLLDALSVLNEAKIIHCDLKPENILLPRNEFCLMSSYRLLDKSSNTRHRCEWWMKVSLRLIHCDLKPENILLKSYVPLHPFSLSPPSVRRGLTKTEIDHLDRRRLEPGGVKSSGKSS